MTTLTRRRSRSPEDDNSSEERPSRGRREDSDDAERPSRGSRRSSRSSKDEDEKPSRGSRGSSRRSRDDDEEKPSRGRGRSSSRDEDKPARGGRRRGNSGFGAYAEMRRASGGKFADEFKPDGKTLCKILDAEPFDVYLQHWIDDGDAYGKGKRHSFVCRDDAYFEDDEDGRECPLCEVGDNPSTMSLFNVLNLANPRKPVVEVWRTTVTVSDKLERAAADRKTSPLNREDLYWEVDRVSTKSKTTWDIQPVKERDLEEDFDVEPLTPEELADYEEQCYEDRTAVIQVDSLEDLADLADSLD